MNQKELTKIFIMISNGKKSLVSMFFLIFSALRVKLVSSRGYIYIFAYNLWNIPLQYAILFALVIVMYFVLQCV